MITIKKEFSLPLFYPPEFATFYFNPNKIFPYFARFSLLFLYFYDIIIK